LRHTVDVLTMMATPIPRTLHMSLLGLRDISNLETAPADRLPVETRVTRFNGELIRHAVMRELGRGGQIFFVHNRVQDIEILATRLRQIVPEARMAIAHGQMPEGKLEKVMLDFVRQEHDLLLATTIIESGLDIPNANTIFIDESDRYGLADLHQLRGRVGRYKHRAYCYLLVDPNKNLTPNAARRLRAIEEFSHLGAGFGIAMRDLEIRGAGNILGPEQSGHINTVGYELYCRLLGEAVRRLTNQPIEASPETVLDLGLAAYIPRSYIASDPQRMDVYRRIADATAAQDLARLGEELDDLFGPMPPAVQRVLRLAEVRLLAWARGIRSIIRRDHDIIFTLSQEARTADLFARAPGRISIPDPRTVYMRLAKEDLQPARLVDLLSRLLGGAKKRARPKSSNAPAGQR
jgi:transcription-repair coupling factor (superfamily II helicase)